MCWACCLGLLNTYGEEDPTGSTLPVVVNEIWDTPFLYPKSLNAGLFFYMKVRYVYYWCRVALCDA